MARQLRAAGEEVPHLILIDAPANTGWRRFARAVIDTAGSWRGTSLKSRLNQLYVFSCWEKRWVEVSKHGLLAQFRFLAGQIAACDHRHETRSAPPSPADAASRLMEASVPIFSTYVWSVAGHRPRVTTGPPP